MHDRHEPDSRFVENLEWQIGSELRRQNRQSPTPNYTFRRFARAAALVVVSIAFGAVAMAASQQIEESWRKDLLISSLEVRHNLALRRVEMATEEYGRIELQYQVGTMGSETLAMARLQLADAEARAKMLELELEEIRISGREPVGEVSSPLVGGRDFVSERIRVQMEVAERQHEMVTNELEKVQEQVRIGVRYPMDSWGVEAAVGQSEEHLRSLGTQLEIRQAFLSGALTAVEAELRVLEAEAEQRGNSMRQQMAFADLERESLQRRVAVGTVEPLALRQAEFRLAELEAEVRLAELEMEILRRELEARRRQR